MLRPLLIVTIMAFLPACGGGEPRNEPPATIPAAGRGAPPQAVTLSPQQPDTPVPFQPEPLPERVRSFCSLPERGSSDAPSGTPVKFAGVRGHYGTPELPLRCVLRNWAEWERLAGHAGLRGFDAVTPELFRESMLIFASMGEQSSGGTGVRITSMRSQGDELVVGVRSDTDTGGEPVTTGLTYPWDLAQVDRSFARVRFLEE